MVISIGFGSEVYMCYYPIQFPLYMFVSVVKHRKKLPFIQARSPLQACLPREGRIAEKIIIGDLP